MKYRRSDAKDHARAHMKGIWAAALMPYAEDLSTYGDALTAVMGRDSPAPIIVGRRPISRYGREEAY